MTPTNAIAFIFFIAGLGVGVTLCAFATQLG